MNRLLILIVFSVFACNSAFGQFGLSAQRMKKYLKESNDANNGLRIDIRRMDSLSVAAACISVIGEMHGCITDVKTVTDKHNTRNVYNICSMTDAIGKAANFIVIVKLKHPEAGRKLFDGEQMPRCRIGVIGRLFLYKNTPATLILEEDIGFIHELGEHQ